MARLVLEPVVQELVLAQAVAVVLGFFRVRGVLCLSACASHALF
ncbi:hypothetical protein [Corynebacterium diphtheriae]|nr:hypothetical protein [Corynebacterium diphtheriae]CAB0616277.1 hypothetical protein CIP107543_01916 [Corynebacterium diphtheriae]